jgi:hypothetical protein
MVSRYGLFNPKAMDDNNWSNNKTIWMIIMRKMKGLHII